MATAPASAENDFKGLVKKIRPLSASCLTCLVAALPVTHTFLDPSQKTPWQETRAVLDGLTTSEFSWFAMLSPRFVSYVKKLEVRPTGESFQAFLTGWVLNSSDEIKRGGGILAAARASHAPGVRPAMEQLAAFLHRPLSGNSAASVAIAVGLALKAVKEFGPRDHSFAFWVGKGRSRGYLTLAAELADMKAACEETRRLGQESRLRDQVARWAKWSRASLATEASRRKKMMDEAYETATNELFGHELVRTEPLTEAWFALLRRAAIDWVDDQRGKVSEEKQRTYSWIRDVVGIQTAREVEFPSARPSAEPMPRLNAQAGAPSRPATLRLPAAAAAPLPKKLPVKERSDESARAESYKLLLTFVSGDDEYVWETASTRGRPSRKVTLAKDDLAKEVVERENEKALSEKVSWVADEPSSVFDDDGWDSDQVMAKLFHPLAHRGILGALGQIRLAAWDLVSDDYVFLSPCGVFRDADPAEFRENLRLSICVGVLAQECTFQFARVIELWMLDKDFERTQAPRFHPIDNEGLSSDVREALGKVLKFLINRARSQSQ
jgi:hypothetical protein